MYGSYQLPNCSTFNSTEDKAQITGVQLPLSRYGKQEIEFDYTIYIGELVNGCNKSKQI